MTVDNFTVQFLSPQWFVALNDSLSSVEPSPTPEARLGVGQIVHDAPTGEVLYTLIVGGNEPAAVEAGSIDNAHVTIVMTYETACAIARGTSTADLLYQGRIKFRGDAKVLLEAQDALVNLSGVLTTLSLTTEF